MKTRILRFALVAGLLPLTMTACGDNAAGTLCGQGTTKVDGECVADSELTCGEGTYEVAGECTPFDPNDEQPPVTTLDPAATFYREATVDVRLLTEPGARIFYTTDGTEPDASSANEAENVLLPGLALGPVTLKFFALDGVGNQEATQTVTLNQDVEGPSTVTNLVVTEESDGSVTVTWTNPTDADFAGVVVMREGKQAALVGGVAASAADVVFVGSAATTTDTPGEGFFTYRVVPFDELLNYGLPATATFDNAPVLVGSTGWSLQSNGTVVAGTTPSGVALSIAFDSGTTFTVSATNNSVVTYQAPKVLFSNIVDGTWGDGTLDSETFVRLGDNGVSLAPGETLTGTFTVNFTGAADGGGVFTATTDLSFRNDPIFLVGIERSSTRPLLVFDRATFSEIGQMAPDIHGSATDADYNGNTGMQGAASLTGNRFIWTGNRSNGVVRKIDTATWTTVAVAEIGQTQNLVGQPAFGPDGLLWVALSTAGPGYIGSSLNGDNIGNFLVGINADTMVEARRIPVSQGGRLRESRLIPNTGTFVIANHTGGRLFVVDTLKDDASATSTITDAAITPSRTVTISADGTIAYLAAQDNSYHNGTDGDVSAVVLATGAVTTSSALFTHEVECSVMDATGLIWYGDSSNLSILDPSDNSVTSVGTFDASALLLVDGKVYAADDSTLREVDPSNQAVLRTASMSAGISGHGLDLVR